MKFLTIILVYIFWQSLYSQEWTANYNGTFSDYAADAAADIYSSVYVAAQSEESDMLNDVILIKYNSAGAEQWVQRYQNAAGDMGVFPYEVECTGNNIYVSAYVLDNSMAVSKQLLIKYNDAGSVQWVKTHTYNISSPVKIKTDNNGNILAVFKLTSSVTMLKYDSAGNLLWTYNTSEFSEMLNDITTDNTGNIYLLGAAFDCILQKVSASGSMLWSRTYNPTANTDIGNTVCIDSNGDVMVTGYITESLEQSMVVTLKYSPAGDTLWSRVISESTYRLRGQGLAADTAGNLWVAYSTRNENNVFGMGIVKYNSSGTNIWDSVYSTGGGNIIFTNIAISKAGRIAVSGVLAGNSADMFLMRSNANGRVVTEFTSATPSTEEYTGGLAVNNSGDVFLTGSVTNGASYDIITHGFIKTIGIQNVHNEIPAAFTLGQNYPNPFNPVTNIEFNIPVGATRRVALKIYDVTGNEIAVLVNQNLSAGTYRVDFNASHLSSGIYFYKLNSGDYTAVKKMVLVK